MEVPVVLLITAGEGCKVILLGVAPDMLTISVSLKLLFDESLTSTLAGPATVVVNVALALPPTTLIVAILEPVLTHSPWVVANKTWVEDGALTCTIRD